MQAQFIKYILPKNINAHRNIISLRKENETWDKINLGSSCGMLLSLTSYLYVPFNYVTIPLVGTVLFGSASITCQKEIKNNEKDIENLIIFSDYLNEINKSSITLNDNEIANLNYLHKKLKLCDDNNSIVTRHWKLNMIKNMQELKWKDAERIVSELPEEK